MKIDPTNTWAAVEAAYEKETNPRHKKLLMEVRNHMKTEVCGDLEGLMDTLTANPEYHMYGAGAPPAPKGRENVRAFYSGMIAAGGTLFEFDVERIFVDDNGVITEGKLRNTYAGATVLQAGVTDVNGEPVDPEATYAGQSQLLTVWPADPDGKLIGEDIYFGSSAFDNLEKLSPDEIPQPISIDDV